MDDLLKKLYGYNTSIHTKIGVVVSSKFVDLEYSFDIRPSAVVNLFTEINSCIPYSDTIVINEFKYNMESGTVVIKLKISQ